MRCASTGSYGTAVGWPYASACVGAGWSSRELEAAGPTDGPTCATCVNPVGADIDDGICVADDDAATAVDDALPPTAP